MIRYALALTWAVSTVALAAAGNISKVNGSIEVETGQEAVTSPRSTAASSSARAPGCDVETVNGSIRLEDRAVATSADTVNGSIIVGEQAEIDGAVGTVNGGVELGKGPRIGGSLETVNGRHRRSTEATVGGGLETVNGDITVGANSRVEGRILVDKPSESWSFASSATRKHHDRGGCRGQRHAALRAGSRSLRKPVGDDRQRRGRADRFATRCSSSRGVSCRACRRRPTILPRKFRRLPRRSRAMRIHGHAAATGRGSAGATGASPRGKVPAAIDPIPSFVASRPLALRADRRFLAILGSIASARIEALGRGDRLGASIPLVVLGVAAVSIWRSARRRSNGRWGSQVSARVIDDGGSGVAVASAREGGGQSASDRRSRSP